LLEVEKATVEADLTWHVRAWGLWVLKEARQELAKFYPTYAEFEPVLSKKSLENKASQELTLEKGLKPVPLLADGNLDLAALNEEFSVEYLDNVHNPRWIPKPTVAYLWARTVKCKACRQIIPLLKTRWLCKKDNKRVLLTMQVKQDKSGVVFGIEKDVPRVGGNTTQKKGHDKKIGAGTMSKSGAQCPCCGSIMTMEDIRFEGKAERLGQVMTAVVMDGQRGKEYRLPTGEEIRLAEVAKDELESVFQDIPFGLPDEETPLPAGSKQNSCSLRLYGLNSWKDIFTNRQLLALGIFIKSNYKAYKALKNFDFPDVWQQSIIYYLVSSFSRLADYSSSICLWSLSEFICHTFTRFALPITWDFVEGNPIGLTSGNYSGAIGWVSRVVEHLLDGLKKSYKPQIFNISATQPYASRFDLICTDPPYYDAISYSDLMDFFNIWIRRIFYGLNPQILDSVNSFYMPLSPKWDYDNSDGKLIDNPTRFNNNREKSKLVYEEGMFRSFQSCYLALQPEGRLVVVFAHKHPDAWETLVSAIIRAGFIVDASWPIQTERETRMRANSSAALSSSVWLVCKKRPQTTRPGWDNKVLEEMQSNITQQLRRFWDDGIRGPDFVWAATGPALEAYSKYPVVKKANEQGELLSVSEFLQQVRRLVLEFVVGRVISTDNQSDSISDLDDITTYYLLHRHDFGLEEAPIGGCILYAVSCGLSDKDLATSYDILATSSKNQDEEEDEENSEEEESDAEKGKGSKVKLKRWQQRKRKTMGYEGYGKRPIPLIDKVHRLMHLWKEGDVGKVDDYLQSQGLRRNSLFNQVLQALIELASVGSDERALLESLSNHLVSIGGTDQLSLLNELKQL
jgi:adenine-specific DNA methylase